MSSAALAGGRPQCAALRSQSTTHTRTAHRNAQLAGLHCGRRLAIPAGRATHCGEPAKGCLLALHFETGTLSGLPEKPASESPARLVLAGLGRAASCKARALGCRAWRLTWPPSSQRHRPTSWAQKSLAKPGRVVQKRRQPPRTKILWSCKVSRLTSECGGETVRDPQA